jgi:sec-independent protein translocase protein TatA
MSVAVPISFLGGAPGGGELLLVFAVLLLLFGAKKLPGIARSLGKTIEEFRRAARDVTDEIMKGEERSLPKPEDMPADQPKSPDTKDETDDRTP